ncbi:hypothetical protein KM043_009858 [Ampulex compressa]|nr:hypothetical protein KM043_009858 [Ampulex compressa]
MVHPPEKSKPAFPAAHPRDSSAFSGRKSPREARRAAGGRCANGGQSGRSPGESGSHTHDPRQRWCVSQGAGTSHTRTAAHIRASAVRVAAAHRLASNAISVTTPQRPIAARGIPRLRTAHPRA